MHCYWFLYFVIFAGSHFVPIVVSLHNEPICSNFHYEEKLLEKMIRMEIRVEQMFQEMKRAKETMTSTADDFKGELENMQKNANSFREDIDLKIAMFSENLEKESAKLPAAELSIPTVAFNSRRTGSSAISASSGDTIVFNEVILNVGDGYNSGTGIFTAPYNGLYYFTSQMCNNKGNYIRYGIVVEDKLITSSTHIDKDYYPCSSINAVAVLNAYDRVWIKLTSGSTLYQDTYRWNSFAGAQIRN